MIFELPDIFFGSHPKKEMASQPPQVRQYGFIKKLEKALSQADFSKIRSYLFRCNKPKKHSARGAFSLYSLPDREADILRILCKSRRLPNYLL